MDIGLWYNQPHVDVVLHCVTWDINPVPFILIDDYWFIVK